MKDKVYINQIDTLDKGLVVTSLPPVQIASERVTTVAVPGRSGYLHISDDSFDVQSKPVGFFYEGDDISGVAKFLMSGTEFTFSNEPDFVYTGRFLGPADLSQIITDGMTVDGNYQFEVTFECNPEKKEVSPQEIEAVSGMSIVNPGNRKTYPTFEITGTGTVVLTVGDQTVRLTNVAGTIIIDGELQECYTSAGISANLQMTGDFPVIEAGEEIAISWTGTVTDVLIRPNWRYVS